MTGAVLTAEDRACFLAAMRRQGNRALHRRINALLLLDDGWTADREAHAELGNDQAAKWAFERLLRLNPADDFDARQWLDLMNAAPRSPR